jgi:glycosyltransferase involved in cell wall biosynthesis
MGTKTKILWLSDHALMNSGVATQSKFLMEGLLATEQYSIYQFGAARKHAPNTKTIKLSDDWIIEPVDGFGTKQQVRKMLIQWKPDVVFIFTDPRFFTWLFEMEDEIHQVCPIVWWHVWDNYPFPEFNRGYYDATDTLNCHSHLTYTMLAENGYADKASFIPHAVPSKDFYPMTQQAIRMVTEKYYPEKEDHWKVFWNNKNFYRKRPGDLIMAWAKFVEKVECLYGHRKVSLFMHTNPKMEVGANLYELAKWYGVTDCVKFSVGNVDTATLNDYYNMCDVTINIAHSEGFGLSTLESMMTGTPIIAPLTGGQIRQVVDYRDGKENGRALPIEMTVMNSTQNVPYIYESWVSIETIADKLLEMYQLSDEQKSQLSEQVLEYANHQFLYEDTVKAWDKSIQETIATWRDKYVRYTVESL